MSRFRLATARLARAFTLLAALLCLTACSSRREPVRREQFLLGTLCSISIYQAVPEQVFTDAFAAVRAVEGTLSVAVPESEVSRVNRGAGVGPVAVSAETFSVIRSGLDFAARSAGAFDISVGPLVSLWGIGTDHARVPSPGEIDRARELVSYRDVVLDDAGLTVFFRRVGMAIDLGGIGKGYAADRAAALLRSRGVGHALLDFGGNIYVVGSHPSRPTWRGGSRTPTRRAACTSASWRSRTPP
jgi:FAD:protein FMN transferase